LRARLQTFVNEQFWGADTLGTIVASFKTDILGASASSKVLLGQDDTLFFSGDGALRFYQQRDPFSDWELDLLSRWFEANRQAVEARGARYLVLITPNKASIHPERLPESVRALPGGNRTDQLLAALADNSELSVVDSRPAVRAAIAWSETLPDNPMPGMVFQRTDTHWNDVGAFAAFEALVPTLEAWFPTFPRRSRADLAVTVEHKGGGDLARFLGLDHQFSEQLPRLRWRDSGDSGGNTEEHKVVRLLETREGPADAPTAIIFRDSFSQRLLPFLAPSFGYAVWSWSYHLQEEAVLANMEAIQADVVITQITERSLGDIHFMRAVQREVLALSD
jgi:hypothetical protein